MPPIATSEPISTPLSNQIREVLQQAADIVGTTLNQFMVQASLEKAQAIVDQEKIIRLSQEDAKVFFNALDNPPPPNENLLEAVAAYKDSSLYAQNRNT
ncbi:hypothetical protein PN36_00485 [Candidatus Thiomargarita nelsonii]|uniref:Protein containing DUF1778 n=1 Tax=Candidatus Thiomargarita nelsonii TaxID=1003181 RepID=A0A0A6P5X7_9GAMM|nr:hypothetical protein PN36_00485 [Candidatus Thiomargarita nelsonii]